MPRPTGMHCPNCDSPTRVVDVSHNKKTHAMYRKRKCRECGYIFYTTCVESREPNSHRNFRIYYRGKGYKNEF